MIPQSALHKIMDSIHRGNCCLVVGPRYRGKSKLIRKVAEELAKTGFYRVAYVSMSEIAQTNSRQFYRTLYESIHLQMIDGIKTTQANVYSASDFRNAMLELMVNMEDNLLLLIDDLELAPPNLISLLLGSIRSVFTTVANLPGPRFQAIVSGTVNLHQLALKGVSRFESVSDLVLVDDITAEEARAFAAGLFLSEGIQVSPGGLDAFLEQTSRDQVLIKQLARSCIELIKKRKASELMPEVLPEAVARILRQKPNFEVAEALSQIEGDPELLSCYLEIAQRGETQINELPLRTADRPNALDLCGVFRLGDQGYSIKAPLWFSILQRHFSSAHCGRLYAIAGYWNKAIEYYQKAIDGDKIDKKSELFGAIINAMQASEDDRQAVEILAQGLHACYSNCEIGIYLRTESVLQLVHYYPGKGAVDHLLRKEIQLNEHDNPEVEALLGPDYSKISRKRRSRFLIPLRVHSGAHATGLISFCGGLSRLDQYKQHEEILQMISFLHQAARAVDGRGKYSTALQDAKLHTQTLESLDHILTSVLHHLELEEEVIFRLLLAGLTANECLGFNRAALFLFDEHKNEMVGTMGVGHLTWEEADFDWKNFPHRSMDDLLTALMVQNYRYTSLHALVKSIRFPINMEDMFGRVHKDGVAHRKRQHTSLQVDDLPNSFLKVIDPADEFVVAPLSAGARRLGLVYVDNKHTHRPIDDFQMASLTDFLTQATLVMEMVRSLRFERQQHDNEMRRLKLEETLRDTSLIIGGSLELKEVLHRILEEMRKVLPFDTASIQLANEETHSLKIIADTGFDDPERVEALVFPLEGDYPNVRVYEKMEPLHFDDIRVHFPHFADPQYQATHARGWLGAPLINNARVIGVITLDSKTPGVYTAEHDRMAVLFAGQASVAIQNARLYETEKETKEYLDLLIGSSQDGIIAVDNHGWVIRYSEGAQKILGYSSEEIKKKRVEELYGSLDVAREINTMLMSSDRVRDYQTTILDKENHPVPIVLSASLLRDKTGSPLGSVGFFKDLRPLRKVENDLRLVLDTVSIMSGVNHSEAGLLALAERIVTAQPVTFCSILLLDESKQNLILKAAYPTPRPSGERVRWGPAIGKRDSLAQTGLMHYLMNLPKSQVFQLGEKIERVDVVRHLREFVSLEEEIRSILIIPLKAGSEVFGICVLGETRSWSRSPFDDEKVELISSMVTQGSVFVDRLQAHEATQNKLMMVERLRSIGEDLVTISSESANIILDKVVRAACDVMGASNAVIYPWDTQMRTYNTGKIVHFGLRKKKPFSNKIRDEEGSMTSIVLRKGIVIVDDVQKGFDRSGNTRIWTGPGGFLSNEGVQSFVGISLRSGEEAFGVLFVNFSEPHYFSNSELETINLFANQAIIAIENARLYEDLALRLEESSTLHKVATSLTGSRDLKLVLDRVLQAVFEFIHADEANILFYDVSKDEFRPDALMSGGVGQPLQTYQTRTRQRDGYTYEIIKNKKHISVPDTTLDPRINPVTLQKGRRAAYGVPLIGGESPVGVLWMHWKTPHTISEREMSLLTAIAGQAAIAIENANLFDQLKAENARQNEESQALQEVGVSLTETIDLTGVLNRVFQAALKLVKADESSILFYDETRDEFQTEALLCAGIGQPLQPYTTRVRQRAGLAYEIISGRKAIFIPDTLLDPRISKVAIEKGRRATVGVPLLDHEGPVGVLWVNWKSPRQVSSTEASLLTTIASQATVAIKGARRYEELQKRSAEIQRRSAHLQAVHEAGKVIAAASVGLDKQQVLDRILEQAIECVTGVSGSKASLGTIQLLDDDANELVVKSVFPRDYPSQFIVRFDHISLDPKTSRVGKIGITGRAVITRQAQLVPDVSKDNDYIMHNEETKSELAIPMLDNGKVIGVMDVESNEFNAFDELDKVSLSLLVDLAVVALQNTDRAEQLARSNAVALMGAWGAEIAHDVNREVGYIRRETFLLQQREDLPSEVKKRLDAIDEYAEHLAQPDLSTREPNTESWLPSQISCNLIHAIQIALKKYQDSHPLISWQFTPEAVDIQVRIHERRLLSILRHLFRNAAHALFQVDNERIVDIRTAVEGAMAIIEVEDTGPGVPLEIVPTLFRKVVSHSDGRKGSGLLLIQFISEQFGGKVELVEPRQGRGACFRVCLPIAPRQSSV